jgi:hypothetical protein
VRLGQLLVLVLLRGLHLSRWLGLLLRGMCAFYVKARESAALEQGQEGIVLWSPVC